MKKKILLFIVAITSVSFCFAQVKTGKTSEEEYNYMTKGYQIQLSSGLDMKKGYSTGTAISIVEGSYSFDFIPLEKNSINTELIGYIVKAKSTVSGSTYWYGLPLGNLDLLNKSFTSIKELDDAMTTAFFKAYMRLQTNLY